MKRPKENNPTTSLYLRASYSLDRLVEEIGRTERRTKVAVLTLALEQYALAHHPELLTKYKGLVE